VFNLTLDLALSSRGTSASARAADLASALWAIYADATVLDRSPVVLAQDDQRVLDERLNVWLIWAIVTRRAYRHVLQRGGGDRPPTLSYSVILYWLSPPI
jgi:hypothetical protein